MLMSSDRYFIKEEYTKQLVNVFEKAIYDIIIKTFSDSETEYMEVSQTTQTDILNIFQRKLLEIRDWNSDRINDTYRSIRKDDTSSETYVNNLIEQVIRSEVSFLLQQNNPEFVIKIPSNELIFFRSLKNTVINIYETPFIVNNRDIDNSLRFEYNSRMKNIINSSIRNTIQTCTINELFLKELKKVEELQEQNESDSESEKSIAKNPKDMGELEKFQETLKSLPNTREHTPISSRQQSRQPSRPQTPESNMEDYFELPREPKEQRDSQQEKPIKVNL